MVRELISVARLRTSTDDRVDHRWPWILVVLDESANVDAALASQLLDLCPPAGFPSSPPSSPMPASPVKPPPRWAVSSRSVAPWRCPPCGSPTRTFRPSTSSWSRRTPADRPGGDVARPAPRRHASQCHDGDPTRSCRCSRCSGRAADAAVGRRRMVRPKPYGLRAPIGIGPAGPLELDLVEHGPHALIGGTTGAARASCCSRSSPRLIHEYPPTRLTFLFVDYKGGASSVVFNDVSAHRRLRHQPRGVAVDARA